MFCAPARIHGHSFGENTVVCLAREPLIKVGVPHHFFRDDRVEPVLILRASSPCPHEKIQLIRASLDSPPVRIE